MNSKHHAREDQTFFNAEGCQLPTPFLHLKSPSADPKTFNRTTHKRSSNSNCDGRRPDMEQLITRSMFIPGHDPTPSASFSLFDCLVESEYAISEEALFKFEQLRTENIFSSTGLGQTIKQMVSQIRHEGGHEIDSDQIRKDDCKTFIIGDGKVAGP